MKTKYQVAIVAIALSVATTTAIVGCGGHIADASPTASSDAGADAAVSPIGQFILSQTSRLQGFPSPALVYSYEADGEFSSVPWAGRPDVTCSTTKLGACSASVCDYPPGTTGDPGAVYASSVNVGPIRVASAAGAITLSYAPLGAPDGGTYGSRYSASGSTQFFKGGDSITISGGGGAGYPDFSESVIAPNDIVITAPDCSGPSGCPDIDSTTDRVVSWTGGGAGKVVAFLSLTADRRVVNASCTFDAAPGTGTIPAAMLAKLRGGGSASFLPSNEGHFKVGTADTTFAILGSSGGALFKIK